MDKKSLRDSLIDLSHIAKNCEQYSLAEDSDTFVHNEHTEELKAEIAYITSRWNEQPDTKKKKKGKPAPAPSTGDEVESTPEEG